MKEAFLNRMRAYLQDEYEDWLACLQQPRFRGLRVNTARCDTETFLRLGGRIGHVSPAPSARSHFM